MLNRELSHFAETSRSGGQISDYICSTFLGKSIFPCALSQFTASTKYLLLSCSKCVKDDVSMDCLLLLPRSRLDLCFSWCLSAGVALCPSVWPARPWIKNGSSCNCGHTCNSLRHTWLQEDQVDDHLKVLRSRGSKCAKYWSGELLLVPHL